MHSRNVPALRLEGFDGEWETTTLGELGSFKSGVGFPEREQGGEAGLPFYKVSDLSAPGNELQLRSANHYVTAEQIVRNHWIPVTAVPAILFAKVGAAVFLGRKRLATDTFLLDNNLMAFSLDTKSWDVQFADTYLKTVDLTRFTQSGALPSLNARHLAEAATTIPPTLEEQQAIGAISTNLDAAINQHTKKHQALQQAKTALMQRMFPQEGQTVPELRLEGFDGEWGVVTVSEIANSFSGGTPAVGTSAFYGGDIPFIRSSEISSSFTELTLTEAGLCSSSAKMVQPGWVLYALYGATAGEVSLAKSEGAINQAILALIPREGFSASYLVAWLRMNKKNIIDTYLQGGQGNLSGALVKNLEVKIPPTFEEQQAIGAVFTRLDTLIATEAKYIESLKQTKTALLQRMFI
ncbi:restriction endonuclease subunit S [Corynebacterium tuberculostearicum]|uniref:restriction endonuclease subunit S n=1 Tax=Corynebacterium tuberculostearicum TaxID=38304 RepID=UPI00264893C1|nr:restriction endonuclease subunit S [Corynebacterium tuberculostearicum]MDV2433443.1 restriction endonuclease subunit S [Corynebacterium tuberculostearicum]WKE60465.1 restriction endonuclease subunit S [Corynebacterium tuberculostearicum]